MKRSWILIPYILKMTRRKSSDYIWNYLTPETRPTWFWSRAWKAKRFACGSIGGGWWLFLLLYCGYFLLYDCHSFYHLSWQYPKDSQCYPYEMHPNSWVFVDHLRFSVRALTLCLRKLFSSLFLRRNVRRGG